MKGLKLALEVLEHHSDIISKVRYDQIKDMLKKGCEVVLTFDGNDRLLDLNYSTKSLRPILSIHVATHYDDVEDLLGTIMEEVDDEISKSE